MGDGKTSIVNSALKQDKQWRYRLWNRKRTSTACTVYSIKVQKKPPATNKHTSAHTSSFTAKQTQRITHFNNKTKTKQ
ncbi:hypothetical protein BDF14DRAFT_1854575 [Spinellus fusiger]|nr:hypothetical protein BDF14DRAFT_1854575 [Spinellus fusiger]